MSIGRALISTIFLCMFADAGLAQVESTENSPMIVESSVPHAMTALLKSRKRQGAWRRLTLTVESSPPHNVTGFDIRMAEPPSDARPPLKKMTVAEILSLAETELDSMSDADVFSGAVLIAKDGKPLLRMARGMASKEYDVPNTPETRFNIGSINKMFTSMAIALLAQDGLIAPDDKLSKFRSDFPAETAEKVTIRHLLTMQSGMGSYWNADWRAQWTTIRTVEDLMGIIREIPLAFEPGTQRQYSNSGYVVLGAIVEKVTGESYYDYVREKIYKPARMRDTDSYELDQIVPNLATGYTVNRAPRPFQGTRLQNNLYLHALRGSPAGGGYSTVDDLNRYVEAMKANALATERFTNLALNEFRSERRPRGIGYAGGAPVGINATVESNFSTGYTVIVLSNYDPPVAEEFGVRMMRLLNLAADN